MVEEEARAKVLTIWSCMCFRKINSENLGIAENSGTYFQLQVAYLPCQLINTFLVIPIKRKFWSAWRPHLDLEWGEHCNSLRKIKCRNQRTQPSTEEENLQGHQKQVLLQEILLETTPGTKNWDPWALYSCLLVFIFPCFVSSFL